MKKLRVGKKPEFPETLNALRSGEESGTPPALVFYGLSDLSESQVNALAPVWERLQPDYRRKVMHRLADVGESNVELDYRAVGLFGLRDFDAEVRQAALDVLSDDDGLVILDVLMQLAQNDEAYEVRAKAASEMGRFILLGEYGEIPAGVAARAQDVLIDVLGDESEEIEVRRRALESIANCGHEIVEDAIREAYYGADPLMRISAVFAMGRTCDTQWEDIVLRELDSSDPEMRFEAARASGELQLGDALPQLIRLTREPDREVLEAAIWSLGEIGGREATRALMRLADEAQDSDDEELQQAIEDAIGSASLTGSLLDFERD